MRATHPDTAGFVTRDGVCLGYEVFGTGEPTVLLLPTWTIIHSRVWKLQVPYLARHMRVITYDGPGNGRSERALDPERYSADAYGADAAAVLDACGADQVVVVGLSLGAQYGIRLAGRRPDAVRGLVLVAPALPLAPPLPERALINDRLRGPAPVDPQGWDRYNIAYWHAHHAEFVSWFFEQALCEPHSTKARDDALAWALESGPEILEAEANCPPFGAEGHAAIGAVACPTMVVHGSDDRIVDVETGRLAADLTSGVFHLFEGSGHLPNLRDPVRFNHLLREFVEQVWS